MKNVDVKIAYNLMIMEGLKVQFTDEYIATGKMSEGLMAAIDAVDAALIRCYEEKEHDDAA